MPVFGTISPRIALVWGAIGVAGCESVQPVRDTFGEKISQQSVADGPGAKGQQVARLRLATLPPGPEQNALVKDITEDVKPGTGRFIAERRVGVERAALPSGREGVTLNLVAVPIAQAAKTVLGDVMK